MYHQHIFPLVFADIIDQFEIPTDTQFYNMQNQFSHYMYMYMQTWICSLSCEIQTVNVSRVIVAHCIFCLFTHASYFTLFLICPEMVVLFKIWQKKNQPVLNSPMDDRTAAKIKPENISQYKVLLWNHAPLTKFGIQCYTFFTVSKSKVKFH